MAQMLVGRQVVKFVPLPVQLGDRYENVRFHRKRPIREVPYVPTPERVVRTMLDVANVRDTDVVYDLGCGDGRIVVEAAARHGARGVGVDVDPRRIQECQANAARAKVWQRVRFVQGSLFNVDVSEATVVALYLLPWMNAQLRPKLLAELRPGSRVVAHQFPINLWPADKTVHLEDVGRVVYCWVVPAKVNGRWDVAVRWPDGKLRRGTMELEQEFQTAVGTAVLNGAEVAMERVRLEGSRLTFALGETTYNCTVGGDAIRGTGTCRQRRGEFEFRGHKA